MQTVTLRFDVSGQNLIAGYLTRYASNTVNYVKAVFDLDGNWNSFDSVRAVWSTDFECISTVLDSEGVCYVPQEVLKRTGNVTVNLVGSIAENDELTDRLTTYPVVALVINANAKVCGTETAEVTPSQFEQYVHTVIDEVAKIKDIESVELNDDYTLTIRFSDDTETTVGPIRGEKGDTGPTGNGIAGIVKTSTTDLVDTYTITYTNGQTTTFNVTNGAKGDTGATGNGIATIAKTSTSGLVDTYTITFTDGTSTTFEVTNGQDGEVTYDELSELLPAETASGDIASFNDGQAVIPAVSCVADIDPIQDLSHGDPSPSNICPISGWDEVGVGVVGVNQWDEEWELGQYYDGDGKWNASGTRVCSKRDKPIPVIPNASYYVGTGTTVIWFDENGKTYNNGAGYIGYAYASIVTAPSNAKYMRFYKGSSYGTTYNNDISINYPSTDHEYHAYVGTTYTTTLPSTTYGGTLDLVSGVLTIDRKIVDMSSLNWSYYSSNPNTARFSAWFAGVKPYDNAVVADVLCSIYPADSYNHVSTHYADKTIAIANDAGVYVYDSSYTDATTFKNAMNGVQLCYELATPTTYQLTPQQIDTLKGQNNITATSGQVSVTYKADIQKYIDNAIATFA